MPSKFSTAVAAAILAAAYSAGPRHDRGGPTFAGLPLKGVGTKAHQRRAAKARRRRAR